MIEQIEPGQVLHLAAKSGQMMLLKVLLRREGVNALDCLSRTPLHYAQVAEVASLLLDHGAQVNAQDALGNAPLHLADNLELALVLIEHGADLGLRNYLGQEPDQTCSVSVARLIALIREERWVEREATAAPRRKVA